jgi:hypothetical protein
MPQYAPRKQAAIQKGDLMKKQTWQAAAFLGVLLMAAVAVGQNNPAVLKADIPFPFVVADHTLPAGRYEVSNLGEHTIRIVNSQKLGAVVLTSRVSGRRTPESSGNLVFYRYQDSYFLAQVWGAGSAAGKAICKSSAEKERQWKGNRGELAVLRIEK